MPWPRSQHGLVYGSMFGVIDVRERASRSIGGGTEAELNQRSGWPRLQHGIELARGVAVSLHTNPGWGIPDLGPS